MTPLTDHSIAVRFVLRRRVRFSLLSLGLMFLVFWSLVHALPVAGADPATAGHLGTVQASRVLAQSPNTVASTPLLAAGDPPFTLSWSSAAVDNSMSVAWGDYDGDGYLDLAVSGSGLKLYHNDGGNVSNHASWTASGGKSIAWGDFDGDGDLDLAAGGGHQLVLYRNNNGVLSRSAAWSLTTPDTTTSIAWGDMNGDGAVDLAVGNDGSPNVVYCNTTTQGSPTAAPAFNSCWASVESDNTQSVAWGDMDGDGDLDLAAGNNGQANRIYLNSGGTLVTVASWSAGSAEVTFSVAWGDVDGDGDLDLAVGNGGEQTTQRNRLYQNNGVVGGVPQMTSIWQSNEVDYTASVSWGDYDGDGDLDLFAANTNSQPNRLYRNDGGTLTLNAVWSSPEAELSEGAAWADYDNDGDLDLAVVNVLSPNRLYRNDGVPLATTPSWSSNINGPVTEDTYSVAWGDYNNDGTLDLAAGNGTFYESAGGFPNRLFRNDYGALTVNSVMTTTESDFTNSLAWGDFDGDGDLDLFAGNGTHSTGQQNRLYRNNGGTLPPTAVWSTGESDRTMSVAWGDYDNDGDLDLAVGNWNQPNRIYRNDTAQGSGSATPQFTLVWSAPTAEATGSVAWGDVDGDGDLDLAVGNSGYNRVYRNDGVASNGLPQMTLVWTSTELDNPEGMAWGDVDGDGDLDLAVANADMPNHLYRNDGGTLTANPVWTSIESYHSHTAAWGDYDGDGDLDLAIGNLGQGNRIYRNDGGTLTTSAVWQTTWGRAVAWGDVDGDGDLDLGVGNSANIGTPNRVYRNSRDGRTLPGGIPVVRVARPGPNADFFSSPKIWSGIIPITYTLSDPQGNPVKSVQAWYSPDGGGRWYSAVASSDTVTRNLSAGYSFLDNDISGGPSFNWIDISSTGTPLTLSDDQIAGPFNIGFNFPFFNQTATKFWISSNGWLAFSAPTNSLYTNQCLPNLLAPASLIAPFWDDLDPAQGGVVRYQLVDPNTLVVAYLGVPRHNEGLPLTFQVILRRDGSITFQYQSMTGTLNSATIGIQAANRNSAKQLACNNAYVHNNLAGRLLAGTPQVYKWDVANSGFFGQSDNVVFRLQAVPAVAAGAKNATPGPYLYGAYASQTYPFRVRGTQVWVGRQVCAPGGGCVSSPVANALVYRLPVTQTVGAEPIADAAGKPFHTDSQGYLQGRGELNLGDRLFALAPIITTGSYRLYQTNGTPNLVSTDAYTVTSKGVQTLYVSAGQPLYLFDLDVSVEWDAHNDSTYLDQLKFNLQRASAYLYDFTNGQMALGQINVYQNADNWAYAHIIIRANNRLRPFSAQGGIVITETIDPEHNVPADTIAYSPGQVSIGATWNRYGRPGQDLGDDWPIILAHELGHYLLYHDDTYLGLKNGQLVAVDTCTGSAMGDLYTDPAATEFIFDEAYWLANCRDTLAEQTLHRNEWQTMKLWYPGLISPTAILSGPALMPFDLTQINIIAPLTPTNALADPTFYLNYQDGGVSSSEARAFLMREDKYVYDLGSPVGGQNRVLAHGAQPGNRLCVFDRPASQFGCEIIEQGDDQITLKRDLTWNPIIQLTPINSTTLNIRVESVPAGLTLQTRLFPEFGSGTPALSLAPDGSAYAGTIQLTDPTMTGHIQVWVNETGTEDNPRRETIIPFSVGGNPGMSRGGGGMSRGGGGMSRGGGGMSRGGGGMSRGGGAPVVSPDGQMIFFTENPIVFQDGQFYTIQGMAGLPAIPPGRTIIGQGYRLSATPGTPVLAGSVSIQYLSNDVLVAGANENELTIYFYDGAAWHDLPTTRNSYFNLASAPSQGTGIYALMSSIQVPLYSSGWNLIAYPLQITQTVPKALESIQGYYNTVYGYVAEDVTDQWKVYQVGGPTFLNDLTTLEPGRGYWISATRAITVHFSPATSLALNGLPASPPDTFYGAVLGNSAFAPAAGMIVEARVNGNLCGRGKTLLYNTQVVYVVDVEADDPTGRNAGCGQIGRQVTFAVNGQRMSPSANWDNNQPHGMTLAPVTLQYLPIVFRKGP